MLVEGRLADLEPRQPNDEQTEALQAKLMAAEATLREQEPALTAFHVRIVN